MQPNLTVTPPPNQSNVWGTANDPRITGGSAVMPSPPGAPTGAPPPPGNPAMPPPPGYPPPSNDPNDPRVRPQSSQDIARLLAGGRGAM